MVEIILFLVGTLSMEVEGALLGCILAILVAIVVQFFKIVVDYSSVENTQFEDDDYYYYVKAVPKVMGGAQRKAARREQPSPRPQQKRTTSSGSGAQRSRSAAKEDSVTGSTR